jgi:hypothetical protein
LVALDKDNQQTSMVEVDRVTRSTYGLCVERVVHIETIDINGDSTRIRRHHGLKVMNEAASFGAVPGFYWTSPGAQLVDGPNLRIIQAPGHAIRLRKLPGEANHCRFQIEIQGGLTKNLPPVDYEIETKWKSGYRMTLEKVRDAYADDFFQKEYTGLELDVPADEILVEVTFPKAFAELVTFYPMVFMGSSEVFHSRERDRIQHCLQTNACGAALHVERPLLGLNYSIAWDCPPDTAFRSIPAVTTIGPSGAPVAGEKGNSSAGPA